MFSSDDAEGVVVREMVAVWRLVETGWWCPECRLPSAATVPLLLVDPVSLRVTARCLVVSCQECGWQDSVDP